MKVEWGENDKKCELKFSKIIVRMETDDLYKIREILLSKKATPDSIRKLEKIDEVIRDRNKRDEYMNRSLGG